MKKKLKTLLIDLDCITVDMLPPWLKRYNEICNTNVTVEDIKEYDVGKVCVNEKVLYSILDEPGFFFNMEPMPGAVKYLQKLIDDQLLIARNNVRLLITEEYPPKRHEAMRSKYLGEST